MTQHITLKETAENALKAYNENRLGAQQIPFEHYCQYRYPNGSGCAIGVGLTKESIEKVMKCDCNGVGLMSLERDSIISYDESEEDSLLILQGLHDIWVTSYEDEKKEKETTFINFLNKILQK